MKRGTKRTLIGLAIASSAAITQTAQAGGITLYEIATPDVGLASAGYAATPVTTDYPQYDNAFTGKILKVTVDLKPIGAAVKAQADASQQESKIKMALSN